MKKGICYGVSVGPGDKNQITIEAIKTIEQSDVIFLPSFPKEECKAYQIIKNIMPNIDEKELCPETFTMSKDYSVMALRHQEIFENAKKYLDEGKNVAFLTLGEVTLFSTYLYIHEILNENGYKSILINGISSVQAICAKLGISLAIGKDEVHIFPNADNFEEKMTMPGTKVFMKTRKNLDEFIEKVKLCCEEDEKIEAMGISNCGMKDEIVATNANELPNLSGYFTVIIVKGAKTIKDNYKFFQNRSCQYFPCHKDVKQNDFNCLFCYCPLYPLGENCGGNFTYSANGIKSCIDCKVPHVGKNYDYIIEKIKSK